MRRGDKSVFKGGHFGLFVERIAKSHGDCYLCGVSILFIIFDK